MLNHLNMEYFITAAKELNFTRAAEKLYISQQALSSHISSLEKEFGVKLFERGPNLRLTYAGTVFLKHALEMERSYHQMCQELGDIQDEVRGEIRIGISHTRGRAILPKILSQFTEEYPLVKIRVLEGNAEELSSALKTGDIDFAIGQPVTGSADIVNENLVDEAILLVVSKKLLKYYMSEEEIQRLLKEPGLCGKDMKLFSKIPFLMNKKGNTNRKVADRIFSKEGFAPNIFIETENIETLGEMCKLGLGAAFYPAQLMKLTVGKALPPDICVFKLDYPFTEIPFAISYRENIYMTSSMIEFINMVKEKLKD